MEKHSLEPVAVNSESTCEWLHSPENLVNREHKSDCVNLDIQNRKTLFRITQLLSMNSCRNKLVRCRGVAAYFFLFVFEGFWFVPVVGIPKQATGVSRALQARNPKRNPRNRNLEKVSNDFLGAWVRRPAGEFFHFFFTSPLHKEEWEIMSRLNGPTFALLCAVVPITKQVAA